MNQDLIYLFLQIGSLSYSIHHAAKLEDGAWLVQALIQFLLLAVFVALV